MVGHIDVCKFIKEDQVKCDLNWWSRNFSTKRWLSSKPFARGPKDYNEPGPIAKKFIQRMGPVHLLAKKSSERE